MIPIKKRNYTTTSQMAPPRILNESTGSQESQLALDLTDWHKRRVLAQYRRNYTPTDTDKKLSASYPSYSKPDTSDDNDMFYYPATIENTNGSLVTVLFDASIEQICSLKSVSRSGQELASSQPAYNTLKHYQHTYDVARDEEKYALIDDAQPESGQLEKGVFVLYRVQVNSASYPSTPTNSTPSSPINYKLGQQSEKLNRYGVFMDFHTLKLKTKNSDLMKYLFICLRFDDPSHHYHD